MKLKTNCHNFKRFTVIISISVGGGEQQRSSRYEVKMVSVWLRHEAIFFLIVNEGCWEKSVEHNSWVHNS